ncbi:MAG TPA: glutathione peroxidase [Bacteriovoracaceae bacterium]|nr:glutathione peroxidase [Bacteriovoracaceae bacterium]
MSNSIGNILVKDIQGKEVKLSSFEGKVLLIVNVASKCGLTPQYEGLENLYKEYREQGFEVLGFPANEFLAQEPGTNEEIANFCRSNYGVDFPMFEKIVVKGEGQHPLYQALTSFQPVAQENPEGKLKSLLKEKGLLSGEPHDITWNFEKFLVDRKGNVVKRFAPDVAPEDMAIKSSIEGLLK